LSVELVIVVVVVVVVLDGHVLVAEITLPSGHVCVACPGGTATFFFASSVMPDEPEVPQPVTTIGLKIMAARNAPRISLLNMALPRP
jgi:hypothetical protein